MTTYSVHRNPGDSKVIIALDGYGPDDHPIGTFEHGVDPVNGQTDANDLGSSNGDHPFVAKAKKVLLDDDKMVNVELLIFVDQASNAPVHLEGGTATDDLQVSEEGSHPNASSQKGGEISVVGTDPAETEPNGVTEKPDDEDLEEEKPSETEEEPAAADEAPDAPVDDLETFTAHLHTITDKAQLEATYVAEQEGENRPEYISAIEARAAELNKPTE